MAADQLTLPPLLGQATPIELMNTVWADRHGIHDSLATLRDARHWLTALAPRLPNPATAAKLSENGLLRLRDLRDALRRLAAERTDDPRSRAASAMTSLDTAIHTVNHNARAARTWQALELTDDGTVTERSHTSGSPDDLLLRTLATQAVALFGRWDDLDLRVCLAPGCVLYFLKDHPRREWCSTACGNRARAARHYARHGRTPAGE
ncbi:CGNR zinc finger domain-containing protein [Actinokineospora sp. PR83]|uniref:CGNR zinc finger domain-containing protein n=1 Tax=Actinokineospora sp. PR83 TaxID=2884908 RepID=UPI001F1664FD|nr:CGNR zinc finger domain-containing protein [Actinokineospora sp. PR83]MCG8915228.1 CGNR zinc finger domain-containing protein [Actinokineospora sp. PR83]